MGLWTRLYNSSVCPFFFLNKSIISETEYSAMYVKTIRQIGDNTEHWLFYLGMSYSVVFRPGKVFAA